MQSLRQISYDGLSRLSHAVDLIEGRSQQNRPLKTICDAAASCYNWFAYRCEKVAS